MDLSHTAAEHAFRAEAREWLRDRVPPETVQDHRRIENSAEH